MITIIIMHSHNYNNGGEQNTDYDLEYALRLTNGEDNTIGVSITFFTN